MQRIQFAALILSLAMITPVAAQTVATATTDLNIRSGPGPEYPVIGHVRENQRINISGCIEGSLWCQVDQKGLQGWAYSQYMVMDSGGRRIVLTERGSEAAIPSVTYRAPPSEVFVRPDGVVTRSRVSGAIVAPTTTVVSDAPVPAFSPPPAAVWNYVQSNPVDPVYLEGEVVVGAGLPQDVALSPVPDYRYQYVYVNSQPILVDPVTRRVVHVFR